MRYFIFICLYLLSNQSESQILITGRVTDSDGQPIAGANVFLEGTYDGATTNLEGKFEFSSNEVGEQILLISFISYETKSLSLNISEMHNLSIILKDDVGSLDTVIITAGTLEANPESRVSVLKPLDIVTTASAVGDVFGALQTLPGTTTVAEDGRLFVRGGSADETQIFIDGMRVFSPYIPTVNNTPTRGRYSPFLFDGITFSTGGYSAEYGEALSSVVLLNTIDEPDQDKTDIGAMSVGATLGNTQKWKNNSLSVNASYINLAPYISLAPDRNDWDKPYESISGETVFRQKTKTGLFKFYTAFDAANFSLWQKDINFRNGQFLDLNNKNLYLNANYHSILGNDWSWASGLSYTNGATNVDLNEQNIRGFENSYHSKVRFKKKFNSRIKLNFGSEFFHTNFNEQFKNQNFNANYGFMQNIFASFVESDLLFSKELALKVGMRYNYYGLTSEQVLNPRAALAFKFSDHSQSSLAVGTFNQSAEKDYLKFNNELESQNTTHLILNYQYAKDGRLLRAELYRKKYLDLVTFDQIANGFEANFGNEGAGYAQGLDVFYRDDQTVKNLDYWISYSYLDTERKYRDFPESARPNFANKHKFSIVTKWWVDKWKSQIGSSFTYASGRPYNDPNISAFQSEKSRPFNSLSLNWAYLLSQQKILYVSVNNVLGFKNVNGYQYANTPDSNGVFSRSTLRPAADQFFFVGFFWTISENKTDNQLDNL